MLPLFNQSIIKVSPMISGIMLIPSAIVMTIMSPIAGRLYDNFGIKKVAFLGMGLGLLFTIPMIFYTANTTAVSVTWIYAARCGALTLAYAPLTVYALNALPKKYVIFGSTLIVNMNQIADSFANAMAATMQSLGQKNGLSHHLTAAAASNQGYQWSFLTIAIFNLIGFILVFKLKNRSQIEF